MGWSLGEFFISLGFDVDDTKLRNFKDNLRSTGEEMATLSTIAAGTVGALAGFVQHAANGAVRLSNMQQLWGANAQAAQTFANALHQVNSQISIAAGQDRFAAFAQMINAKVPVGSSSAVALSQLGVTNPWSSPEDVWGQIRHNLPGILPTLGATPEKARARAADLLGQAGIGAEALPVALEGDDKYNAASKYNISSDVLGNLSKFAAATAEFDEAMNKFSTDMAGEIGPKLAKVVEYLTSALNALDSFNSEHPGMATAEAAGGGLIATLGIKKAASWALSKLGGGSAGAATAEAAGGGALASTPQALFIAAMAGLGWYGGNAIGNMLKGGSGGGVAGNFTSEQRAGILRALRDESGQNLDPNAVGDSGLAYGIAQWHPDRQANFARWAGHGIRGSSREEQLAFVNYELTQGMEQSAGQKISRAQSEQEAYLLTKKYYERPAGAQNITISVHSNATDNQEVANLVKQHFENTIGGAFAQTNLGAQQ